MLARISLDVDGVLLDQIQAFRAVHRTGKMLSPVQYDFSEEWGLDRETYKYVITQGTKLSGITGNYMFPEVPSFAKELERRGVEVHIVTARSAQNCLGFLRETRLPIKTAIFDCKTPEQRQEVIHALDVDFHVDDYTENLKALWPEIAMARTQTWNAEWDGQRIDSLMELFTLQC